MRNAGVEQVVADLAPDADLEMIIEVNTEQAERNAVGIPDIGARMEKLRQVYREAKLPLIEALAHYQSEGLDIVNELPSTSQLILAGPAQVWMRMIDENRDLLEDEAITIHMNRSPLSAIAG